MKRFREYPLKAHQKSPRGSQGDDGARSPMCFARRETTRKPQRAEQRSKGLVQRFEVGRPYLLGQTRRTFGRLGFRDLSRHAPSARRALPQAA